jgi:hypothetical protein
MQLGRQSLKVRRKSGGIGKLFWKMGRGVVTMRTTEIAMIHHAMFQAVPEDSSLLVAGKGGH